LPGNRVECLAHDDTALAAVAGATEPVAGTVEGGLERLGALAMDRSQQRLLEIGERDLNLSVGQSSGGRPSSCRRARLDVAELAVRVTSSCAVPLVERLSTLDGQL
jgi:hypothetical protein